MGFCGALAFLSVCGMLQAAERNGPDRIERCACGACVSRRRKQSSVHTLCARVRESEPASDCLASESRDRSCFSPFVFCFYPKPFCAFCDEGSFSKEKSFSCAPRRRVAIAVACFGGR